MSKDNVIKFQPRENTVKTVEISSEEKLNAKSLEFSYDVLDIIHDMIHEQTGDCIFTDDDYKSITICTAEVVSAIYLMSQGLDHPFHEISKTLFNDVDIDNKVDYDIPNVNDDEDT